MALNNRSKWWLDTIKNEKEKWIDTSTIRRNRTKIFVYPFGGQGYFENLPIKTTAQTIAPIETTTHGGNYVILPGCVFGLGFNSTFFFGETIFVIKLVTFFQVPKISIVRKMDCISGPLH